ncbi:MAG: ABC transporter permease [Gemmatimonadaceae bacterium]|nr:ABC transporter permease [Polyangiaceae bacterium]NUQ12626.1 ABC transporter permease [Gemmatimonadaceae bacterium]
MSNRRYGTALSAVASLVFALLYAPLFAVAVYSFNRAEKGSVWAGFSLRWYLQIVADPEVSRRAFEVREAALNTLLLGAASTLIATILGTLLAIGIQRTPWSKRAARLLDAAIDLPVVTPDIVFATALLVAFNVLRYVSPWFNPGLPAMIIGHVTLQIAFVALIVRSRLVLIGATLSEAARDLYATSAYHFRRVTLPLLWPAIVAGGTLAFTLSLNDFVISFFTCGPGSVTLPIYVYHSQMRGLRTDLFAVSTLFVLGTIGLVLTAEQLTRWRRD